MLTTISVFQLLPLIRQLPKVSGIEPGSDHIKFRICDRDGDHVLVIATIDEGSSVTLVLPVTIPKDHAISATIVGGLYNGRKDACGTHAYGTWYGDKFCLVLEKEFDVAGGVSEEFVRRALQQFVAKIDVFEDITLDAVKTLGPDTSFLKSGGGEVVWEALGAFVSGLLGN